MEIWQEWLPRLSSLLSASLIATDAFVILYFLHKKKITLLDLTDIILESLKRIIRYFRQIG